MRNYGYAGKRPLSIFSVSLAREAAMRKSPPFSSWGA